MKKLKDVLYEYLTPAEIQLCELEENAEDLSGWMLKNGFSKKVKKTMGKFFHYEYVLTDEGKTYINTEYAKRFDELFSKIENENPESEFKLISTIKSLMKNNYDEYTRQKKELNRREFLAIQHLEKQIF